MHAIVFIVQKQLNTPVFLFMHLMSIVQGIMPYVHGVCVVRFKDMDILLGDGHGDWSFRDFGIFIFFICVQWGRRALKT